MLKLLLIALGAIAAGWLSLAVGAAGTTRQHAPQRALEWWPNDARALAELASRTLAEGSPAQRREAGAMAARAIRRDPLLPDPYAVLALSRVEDERFATRMMGYSQDLSRRNLATQLWLIEDAVRRNDVAGALRHYDTALRASPRAPELLFPVLSAAIAEPAVTTELARVLAREPRWRIAFIAHAIEHSPVPARIDDLSRLSARLGHPFGAGLDTLLITRLVDEGQYRRALALYERAIDPAQARRLIRNGGFERPGAGTSFDWLLFDEGDLWARRGQGPDGIRLEFGANAGRGGAVARQTLLLPPGRYRLGAESGSLEGGDAISPTLVVRCAGEGGAELLRLPLRMPADGAARSAAAMAVPAGCPAQTIALELVGDPAGAERSGWIDSLTVAPASAS